MIRLDFPTTNNEVEYETLIADQTLQRQQELKIWSYTMIPKQYECKNEQMKKYLEQVKDRVSSLQVKFVQIPREENKHANRLAKAASAEHMVITGQVLSFV